MILLELEDFDCMTEFAEALDGIKINELVFSPMFVFIIDWAYKREKLDDEVKESAPFKDRYPKLLSKKITFSEFVLDVLDSKIIDTNFTSDIRKFISDYVEYDGYRNDLLETFKISNLWFLKDNFEKTDQLYKRLDKSFENYIINKENYPELIIFYDPEQLKKERDIHDKKNI